MNDRIWKPYSRRIPSSGSPAAPAMPARGTRLTAKQDKLYWREWGKARKALRAAGFDPADADAQREIYTTEALGSYVPHREMSNAQLDRMLEVFRAIAAPDDISHATDVPGPRRRLLYGIAKLATGREDYIREICLDCGLSGDWRRLSDTDLSKLRSTMARRFERKGTKRPAKPAPHPEADSADIPF